MMIKFTIKVFFRILFLVYLSTVIFLCLYSFTDTGIDLNEFYFGIRADRVAHFIMLLPYPFAAWFAIDGWFKKVFGKYSIPVLFCSGVLLAGVVESLQNFNPNRDFDPFDIVANVAGVLTGTIFLLVFNYILKHVWPGRLQ